MQTEWHTLNADPTPNSMPGFKKHQPKASKQAAHKPTSVTSRWVDTWVHLELLHNLTLFKDGEEHAGVRVTQ